MKAKRTERGPASDHRTTLEVARELGMAVRSVQLMVDRGDLEAWKTPGGHRRISSDSVQHWLRKQARGGPVVAPVSSPSPAASTRPSRKDPGIAGKASRSRKAVAPRVVLIEDSRHFQNLVTLLVRSRFPQVELHVADDGISGLTMAGRLDPEVLLIDILLPGIDGATLITGLRSNSDFAHCHLIVITSLEGADLEPYAFALEGVPVVHKPRLAVELPPLMAEALAERTQAAPV